MTKSIHVVPNVTLEKLRQQARKIKREAGIPHHQALEQVAVTNGFNHWHHVVESANLTSLTEKAFYNGLIIAMDVKDAQDFHDPKNRFVEDDQFCFICRDDFFEAIKDSIDDEDKRIGDYLSDNEINEILEDDMMNYIFLRYVGNELPEKIEDVLPIIRDCSFWNPHYVWFRGESFDTYSLSTEDSEGNVIGVRL